MEEIRKCELCGEYRKVENTQDIRQFSGENWITISKFDLCNDCYLKKEKIKDRIIKEINENYIKFL